MKKWKKWTVSILSILFIAILSLYFIRQKQINDFNLNYIGAKHENRQSILKYISKKNIPGEILIAKDTLAYERIFELFAPGNIIVLDSKNNIVDCNFGNYQGSCYSDIAEQICNDFSFLESEYNHKIVDSSLVNTLKSSTISLTTFSWDDFKEYDFTVIFCWAKWMKSSYTNEGAVQKIAECIKRNKTKKVLLLSVNTDCVSPWYPMSAKLPD